MGCYRNRLQIIADILFIVSEGAKKTQIMYRANLSYRLLCRYLEEVLNAGLVSFESRDCYMLTVKGKKYLNRHEKYSKRCNQLKEQLSTLNNDKVMLENLVNVNVCKRSNEKLRNNKVR